MCGWVGGWVCGEWIGVYTKNYTTSLLSRPLSEEVMHLCYYSSVPCSFCISTSVFMCNVY
jgi:hypothetical protein